MTVVGVIRTPRIARKYPEALAPSGANAVRGYHGRSGVLFQTPCLEAVTQAARC